MGACLSVKNKAAIRDAGSSKPQISAKAEENGKQASNGEI